MKYRLLLPFLLFLSIVTASGQSVDSLSERLPLPAGLTPVVPLGQVEIVLFNSLATYQSKLPSTSPYPKGRGNTEESVLQAQFGLTRNHRFSAGFDAWWSNYRFGSSTETAAFAAFGSAPDGGIAAHAISQIGLKARVAPFARLPQLIVQARVLFPTVSTKNIERTLLNHDRTNAQLQCSYLQWIAPRLYGYAQVEWGAAFKNDIRKQTTWNLPIQLYLLYRLLRNREQSVAVFAGAGQTTFFEKQFKGGLRQVSYGRFWLAGGQWQLGPHFGVALAYQGALSFDADTPIIRSTFHGLNLNLWYVGRLF